MTRNIDQFIYKTDPLNFVPFSRTPWAGEKLSFYKKNLGTNIPTSIGETWEISTDAQYPSLISGSTKLLKDCIKENPIPLLGSSIVKKYGTQNCPLLLKWLHAKQPLSVQLHPPHGDREVRHEPGIHAGPDQGHARPVRRAVRHQLQ